MELLALIGSTEAGTEALDSQQNDREDSLPTVQEFALDKILEKFPPNHSLDSIPEDSKEYEESRLQFIDSIA